jgi:hypothetical protein
MDGLEKVADLRLGRADRSLHAPLSSALLAQMQLSHPAPLDFSELDDSFSIFAQIANHLYDDLVNCGATQPSSFKQQHMIRARGKGAVMGNDDHPDL